MEFFSIVVLFYLEDCISAWFLMPKITINPVLSGNDILLSGIRKSILAYANDN